MTHAFELWAVPIGVDIGASDHTPMISPARQAAASAEARWLRAAGVWGIIGLLLAALSMLALPMPGWAETLREAGNEWSAATLHSVTNPFDGGLFAAGRPIATQVLVLGLVFNALQSLKPARRPSIRRFWAWQLAVAGLLVGSTGASMTVFAESLPVLSAVLVIAVAVSRLDAIPGRSPATWFATAAFAGLATTVAFDLVLRLIEPPLPVRLVVAGSWLTVGLMLPGFAIAYRLVGTWRSHRLAVVHLWLTLIGTPLAGLATLHHTGGPTALAALGTAGALLALAGTLAGVFNLVAVDAPVDASRRRWLNVGLVAMLVVAIDGGLLSLLRFQAVGQFTAWQSSAFDLRLLVVALGFAAAMLVTTTSRATLPFWTIVTGIALAVLPGHLAGLGRGLMWQTLTPTGALRFPEVIETTRATAPLYTLQAIGWLVVAGGWLWLAWPAIRGRVALELPPTVTPETATHESRYAHEHTVLPLAAKLESAWSLSWHRKLERRTLATAAVPVVVIAGAIGFSTLSHAAAGLSRPPEVASLSPLEEIGRDVYRTHRCNQCHTQVVRPILGETRRYGDVTSMPDRFEADLIGVRRVGPDLARVGGKFDATWHLRHFESPQAVLPRSLMPAMPDLLSDEVDLP
ncbi:MAG: cbb3-type cytochrome c oxidase subunit II, partial [Planctomycetota bacterium]